LVSGTAFAGTFTDRPLLFSFNGADTTSGAFSNVNALDVDQSSGTVYVIDVGKNVLDKFNLNGEAQDYSVTGTSSLSPGFGFDGLSDVAVDNSSVNPGRIHVMPEFGPLKAFSPGGSELWQRGGFSDVCGLAVDTEGHPWVGNYAETSADEFASSGSPPAKIGSVVTEGNPCRLDVDASGNVYVNRYVSGVDKYVGGAKTATIDPGSSNGVTVDQSSPAGHVFIVHGGSFSEYDSSGTFIGEYGAGQIGNGKGIAYDSAQDRVYVADEVSGTVRVFGPTVSSPVPDATIEATSEIGISKARFNGTVNPQGLPSSYHFEWKQGEFSSWSGAQSSPAVTLPQDNSNHPVSFEVSGLAGGSTYQVRLVAVNTENALQGVSGADTFSTASPPAPAVMISPLVVGPNTAQVSGTVNPQGDAGAGWYIETSTDPACTTGFAAGPSHSLSSETSSPLPVSEELTGLVAAQHYCVRIAADNGGGTTRSEVKEFNTEIVPPSQVQTSFVAPRLDTSVRLNGSVNPEGAPFTYRFEYREDGGASWIALPEHEDTSGARKPILVDEELNGLNPGTAYNYRFLAENVAGPASPQGEEKTFDTRTSAEVAQPETCPNEEVRLEQNARYLPDCRAFELVNSPDKGNQNIEKPLGSVAPITQDGNRAFWELQGGSPEGYNGTASSFLAKRGSEGWRSRSIVPPTTEQIGAGHFAYQAKTATPLLTHFLFNVGESSILVGQEAAVMVDDEQRQERLTSEPEVFAANRADMTEDGRHVLAVRNNSSPPRLVDFGQGNPELVSVMPDGLPNECGIEDLGGFVSDAFSSTYFWGVPRNWRPGYHLIATTDASIAYFEVAENGACNGPVGLYVRDRAAGETTRLDAGPIGQEPQFIRTSPDGRHAFFTSTNPLAAADANNGRDVYRWDKESNTMTCLTCVVPNAAVGPAVFVSDDFSHIYFMSRLQLVPGHGTPGSENVYALSDRGLHFVAAPGEAEVLRLDPFRLGNAELSSDGEVLVFGTTTDSPPASMLTADSIADTCDAVNGSPGTCGEVFRYDDRDQSLECVSCAHDGTTNRAVGVVKSAPGTPRPQIDAFAMSSDGSTLAFVTEQRLLPGDVNNDVDIYRWKNGRVSLLTDGVSGFSHGVNTAPSLVALSQDGGGIFFTLAATKLTGFEQDGLGNLYVARSGGGFEPPSPPAHCSEESCQGPLAVPPRAEEAASITLAAGGTVTASRPRRCAHGRRAKKRCARKRHPKAHPGSEKTKTRTGK
jgi:hypothetical protein